MGLTKRRDGWYVEFRVVDDDKVLLLPPRGTLGGKLKRWKIGNTTKTVAKIQEAQIRTDLLMGNIGSKRSQKASFS